MIDLNKHLKTTFAQKHLDKSVEGCKAYHDQKASHDKVQVGDKVMTWLLILILLTVAALPEIVEQGLSSGIVLKEQPRLLITNCSLRAQRVT